MSKKIYALMAMTALTAGAVQAHAKTIVETSAYRWHGDTITQGEFMATAPSATELISTYHAQPGYFMPIEPRWTLRNDISSYPQLKTSNTLHTAIYNLGLDEMVNAVEPDTTLRTGKEWAGVWTRDVSYSIILSMAYMQPEASKISLMKKVNANGRIIQDTGSGGAWPVSSDRMIWAVAAYELYKVTGDRDWLRYIYPIIRDSFADDFLTVYDTDNGGMVKGETSFIDWREQSYPRWMQCADIYQSQALGTSVVHARALEILSDIAAELGQKAPSKAYAEKARQLNEAINANLWMPQKGYYAMYDYGRDFPILNPRAETLGESLAILFGTADAERARLITENNPTTPFGAAIFFPQIADIRPYHNNSLWPWVAAYWALANAKAGNEQGTLKAIGSVFRPAALFTTNKENFVLDNGDIATELNSSNMLWCLAGNIAITHRILFGIGFEPDRLTFAPFVPQALADTRSLEGFRYRDAVLDITVSGYGNEIKSFRLDGKERAPFVPANLKGRHTVVIEMADNQLPPMRVNHTANVKAPLTPIAWLAGDEFCWNPIEYIDRYVVLRNGRPVATTTATTFKADVPGEYQVVGVSSDGVESFASEPVSNARSYSFELPGESTAIASKEVSYHPRAVINDFTGAGFREVDTTTPVIEVPVTVDADGLYSIKLRYANGNGPVNTENKCAIRTITVDGNRIGIVVMPHRGVGNWNDWGLTNTVQVPLTAGAHTVAIEYRPENTNMNIATNHALIDQVVVTELSSEQ